MVGQSPQETQAPVFKAAEQRQEGGAARAVSAQGFGELGSKLGSTKRVSLNAGDPTRAMVARRCAPSGHLAGKKKSPVM